MSVTRLKVLVYDDQKAVVDALALLLDLHGIEVLAARSPDDALRLVSSDDVGVVVQDMNFGPKETSGAEGVRLFRRIREQDPEMPVLLITAWASLETAVQLIKEGASDYLAKPWDDEKLVLAVKNLLKIRALQLENRGLRGSRHQARQELARRHDLCGLVYESDALHQALVLALQVATSDAPVLIHGPSGSGKEKIAEIIQANSRRRGGPFIRVNLGAIPVELMESELFGAEKGAYTGAGSQRAGRFEAADGGTLFLDEIDGLPMGGQVKLLRVLQSGEYQRLGSSETRRTDTRIISATNSDLQAAIAGGEFREDLFFRLNVIGIGLPALRDRPQDILPLARHFLQRHAAEALQEGKTPAVGGDARAFTPAAEHALLEHDWPGNVRELENHIRRALLVCRGGQVDAPDLDLGPENTDADTPDPALQPADRAQRLEIEKALVDSRGVVAKAAEELGLSRQALYRKMNRLGIILERRPKT